MTEGVWILLFILVAGVVSQNDLLAISAAIMLFLCVLGSSAFFHFLEGYGVQLGVIFLMVGLLLPFATGQLGIKNGAGSLLTLSGMLSVVIGAAATYLGSRGVSLLAKEPGIMLGLMAGSVLGVAFLRGIPVGPLVTAGLLSIAYQLLGLRR